jgi:hypothetical protein
MLLAYESFGRFRGVSATNSGSRGEKRRLFTCRGLFVPHRKLRLALMSIGHSSQISTDGRNTLVHRHQSYK